eukprot:343749_1
MTSYIHNYKNRRYYNQVWTGGKRRYSSWHDCFNKFIKFVIAINWEGAPEDSSIKGKISNECYGGRIRRIRPIRIPVHAQWIQDDIKSVGAKCELQKNPQAGDFWGNRSHIESYTVIVTIYPQTRQMLFEKEYDDDDMHTFVKELLIISETALKHKFKSLGLPQINCNGWIYNEREEIESIGTFLDSKHVFFRRKHVSTIRGYSHYVDKHDRIRKSIRLQSKRKQYDDDVDDETLEPLLKRQKLNEANICCDLEWDIEEFSSDHIGEYEEHNFQTDENGFLL